MLREFTDAAEFAEAAAPLLLSDVGRYNLMLGISHTLVTVPERYPERRLWVVEDASGVVGAALRTPPFHLLIAGSVEPLAATGLDVPGVNGAEPEVHRFAAAWTAATGGTSSVHLRLGVHRLDSVEDVPVPSGRIRRAAPADRDLLVGWMLDFTREAGLQGGDGHASESVDAKLGNGDDLVIWEDRRRGGLDVRLVVRAAGVRPRRPGVYAPHPARPRLRNRAGRGAQPPAARGRPLALLPVHRPREPDLERHLPQNRLPAYLRGGRGRPAPRCLLRRLPPDPTNRIG